jgi:hypothetical protein
VAERAGGYQATEQGQVIRQAAEDATDQLFYAPWSCLDEDEFQKLGDLLTRLGDRLQQMADRNTS